VAAFTAFELGLYFAGAALPGTQGAFTAQVVWHVFLVNAVSLCALMAVYQLVMAVGFLTRHNPSTPLGAGAASFR